MKTRLTQLLAALLCAAFTITLHAQTTAFTYQGRLTDNGTPATGIYDLQFTIYDADTGGSVLAGPITNSPVAVTNGLFTTTLDFGAGVFDGSDRWLEIAVQTNGGGGFTTLAARQQVTSAPYAIYSEGGNAAGLSGTIPMASLSGTYGNTVTLNNAGNSFTGDGSGLTGLNAAQLTGGAVPASALANAWKATGNSGTTPGANFVGTTDNQPVELRANGERILRLEPTATNGSPNVIGGSSGNFVSSGVVGAIIAGGGATDYDGVSATNNVAADFGAILGGDGNRILEGAHASTIGGGENNRVETNNYAATISGGLSNSIATYYSGSYAGSSIAGGVQNSMLDGQYCVIGGGVQNSMLDGQYCVIAGGEKNTSDISFTSTLSGGYRNMIYGANYGTIGGGGNNVIYGQDQSGACTIGGGEMNSIGYSINGTNYSSGAASSTIGGGQQNVIQHLCDYAMIGGGNNNSILENNAYVNNEEDDTIAGGGGNSIDGSQLSFIGGGFNNAISAGSSCVTLPGGYENVAGGFASFAAGTQAHAVHDGAFVWADSDTQNAYYSDRANQVKIRAGGGMMLDVNGSAGLNPAAFQIHSTSGNGVGFYVVESSSDAAVVVANSGTGDLIKGFGLSGQDFEVVNDGTVYSKGFALTSDRNAKENFTPINVRTILDKVAALPISEWNYKADRKDLRHLGPMAQDFQTAFGLDGKDDKHISVVDEGGVALAAIQGLNQKMEIGDQRSEVRIQKLEAENTQLKQQLNQLAWTVNQLKQEINGGAR